MIINEIVERAKSYLLAHVKNGFCQEFHQLRHGPSLAWTSACIGSTLAEFRTVPQEMLNSILSLQWDCGGWSYNQNVAPDADSTLRVLQFLDKVKFNDRAIINKAEKFVIAHQKIDGGIATYLPETAAMMGYSGNGWASAHPCVTALAIHVLKNKQARYKANCYIKDRLQKGDARAYWWATPWYVRYESGYINGENISNDPIEISLVLLLKARFGLTDKELILRLIAQQFNDGSFPTSHQFRIPRPNQFLNDITAQVKVIEDHTKIFSTAAAVVAISRQKALLN